MINESRNPHCLLLAVWFGMLTGLGEASLLIIKKFVLPQLGLPASSIFFGPHVAWMAPVADVLLFALPGLILFLAARSWPTRISLRVVVLILSFLSFLSWFLMSARLHRFAALLLAGGFAVQTAYLVTKHTHAFLGFVRHSMKWAVALIVTLMVSMFGWEEVVERRALAAIPPAAGDAPNVLLIVMDTVRARNLSLYGYARSTTPQLERLAKGGIVFEHAVSTAPWTLPSHASMFTGRWAHELAVDWKVPLDGTYPTLAEILSARGYVTAGFIANLPYCSYEHGLSRGFAHYEDFPISLGQMALSSSLGRTISNSNQLRHIVGNYELLNRKTAASLNGDFLRWLSGQSRRPFFAFLNYYDAHEPYLPPEPFDTKFGSRRPRGEFRFETNAAERADKWKLSPEEVQVEIDAYDGAIAYLDHHLGLLFDELRSRGVLEDTLVIVTSDHGEEFGGHGYFSHGNTLYLPSLRVPLLISFPSHIPAGERVEESVSLRDLPATIIDLLNLDAEPLFPGDSMARYWDGTDDLDGLEAAPLLSEVNFASGVPEWYPVSKGDMKSLIIDQYHYIKHGDGREELYDIERDPREKQDLISSRNGRLRVDHFRASLEQVLQKTDAPDDGRLTMSRDKVKP